MKSVRYVGPHDAVSVPLPDGREIEVARGELLHTSDEHIAALLDQPSNWRPTNWKPDDEEIGAAAPADTPPAPTEEVVATGTPPAAPAAASTRRRGAATNEKE